jgi:hypothetical protein
MRKARRKKIRGTQDTRNDEGKAYSSLRGFIRSNPVFVFIILNFSFSFWIASLRSQ